MTGAEIVTKFEEMVQDTLDETFVYQLLNDAKDEVEAEQVWLQLLKETSYSIASGYSYSSSAGALPTRFALDVRVVEDTSDTEYGKVDFDDRSAKRNDSHSYFLDINGDTFHLGGENHNAKTIYFYYTEYSADITSGSSWAFPDRFHSILPLKMAELYYAADAGEKSRAWDDRWAAQYERELNRMTMWNDRLRVQNKKKRSLDPSPKSVGYTRRRKW